MLLAASVACIVTYIDHYSLHDTLVILIIVLVIFLIIGLIVKRLLDKFEISTVDSVDDEGEVVEKSAEGEEGAEGEAVLQEDGEFPEGEGGLPAGEEQAVTGES